MEPEAEASWPYSFSSSWALRCSFLNLGTAAVPFSGLALLGRTAPSRVPGCSPGMRRDCHAQVPVACQATIDSVTTAETWFGSHNKNRISFYHLACQEERREENHQPLAFYSHLTL